MAFFGMPLLALVIVFLLSQRIGGRAWDEDFDYRGVAGQLDVAYRYITGDAGANFTQVPNDFAYYGIVAVLPAYVAERVATYYGFPDALAVYVFALHAVAFSCSVFTVLTTFFILLRATGSRTAAGIGAGLLAIYPLWFGFSFFDHKDVPTAFFFTLALYGGVGLLQAADEDRTRRFFTLVLAMATILIAGLKIIALILVVPSWVAAFYVYLRGRDFKAALMIAAVTIAGITLVTPVAWSEPFNFVVKAINVMSRHAWSGCTLSAGTNMCTHGEDWIAAQYIATWYIAQVPLLIGLGAVLAVLTAPWRGRVQVLIAASLAIPILLISLRNSTLYDGLRQILFTIPAMFILATMFWLEIWRQTRSQIIPAVAVVLAAMFVWENVAMFPYNYVYFNLPTRMFAKENNIFTDFWGFSLREAAGLQLVNDPSLPVVGNPLHLVQPYLQQPHPVILWPGQMGVLPKASEYIIVSYVRDTSVPDGCSKEAFVTRQLPMGHVLKMSFAARCKIQ